MLRETAADLQAEAEILDLYCSRYGFSWRKLGNGGKYRIDAVITDGDVVCAWVEVKDYRNRKPYLGLNVPKFMEGVQLSQFTGLPFLLILRHTLDQGDEQIVRLGALNLCENGMQRDGLLVMAGGTPPGRQPLPDDIEPMYRFHLADVCWKD